MTARDYIARAERALLTGQPTIAQRYMRRASELLAASRRGRALRRIGLAIEQAGHQIEMVGAVAQETARSLAEVPK